MYRNMAGKITSPEQQKGERKCFHPLTSSNTNEQVMPDTRKNTVSIFLKGMERRGLMVLAWLRSGVLVGDVVG
jgi:hypothetical protein